MLGSERFDLSSTKDFIFSLVVIGLLALVMRIVVGDVLKPISHVDGMSQTYFTYAENLIEHGTYSRFSEPDPQPDSLRMPLYSFFLAGIRLLSGPAQWANWVVTIQYILGSLTCVLIAILGRQICSASVGIIAGFLAVFNVDYYYLSLIFLRETLSLFSLLLFFVIYIQFLRTERWAWGYVGAFLFGMGILIRPETVLTGFLLVVFFYMQHAAFFKKKFLPLLLILLLSLGPWLIWMGRNFSVHKHLVPFSTDGAWGLYMGQVFHPDEAYTVADPKAMEMIKATPIEYEWASEMKNQAIRAFLEHPGRNIYWMTIKVRQTFFEFTKNGMSLLYPLLWVGISFFAFRHHPHKKLFLLAGVMAGLTHLILGDWNPTAPIGLLHTKFKDLIIPGAIGFTMLILQDKNIYWKVLAASFLTLIVSVVVFIAHLRARLVLCDWILMIGTAFAVVELTKFIAHKTAPHQTRS